MSNPVVQAFFLGRALAEVLKEKLEETLTNGLSELGKFDAEQREKMRQFAEEVRIRAERESSQNVDNNAPDTTVDLQETIDELRAEIARLRAQLKNYRQ